MRGEYDNAKSERVLQHPSVDEPFRSRLEVVRLEQFPVNIQQRQHVQQQQRQSHLEAVQIVEVAEHAPDELVSHPEPFHAVGRPAERRGVFQKRPTAAAVTNGPRTTVDALPGVQHRRVPVDGDGLRPQLGHLLVDRLEFLIQTETPGHKAHFGGANARVLHVHQHGESRNDRVVHVPVHQIDAEHVHGQYDDRVRERDGRGEQTAARPLECVLREVRLIGAGFPLVPAGRAAQFLAHDRDPRHEARDGHGSRVHRLHGRRLRVVALDQGADVRGRVQVAVNARGRQHRGVQRLQETFTLEEEHGHHICNVVFRV